MAIHDTEKTLVILDPTLKKGFTAIPNAVVRAPGLSMAAKGTYAILLSYAWQDDGCFPGQERLAQDGNCDVRSIRRYLVELRDYGLISWRQRGLNRPNVYFIHDLRSVPALNAYGAKDSTNLSGPDRTEMSFQDRTETPHYEDSVYKDSDVVVDPPCIPPTRVTAAHEPVAQPGHAQSADKPVDQPGDTHVLTGQDRKQSGLERKHQDEGAAVAEIRAAIRAATGAEAPAADIHALLADYSAEFVLEKVQLLADMGQQELRNIPGLLRYLLAEDCRHIPGRARGGTIASKRRPGAADHAPPGRTGKRRQLDPHDYLDPEQAAKLEALRAVEAKRTLAKELEERERAEKRREMLKTIYVS